MLVNKEIDMGLIFFLNILFEIIYIEFLEMIIKGYYVYVVVLELNFFF